MEKIEITAERYNNAFECLPPIYLRTIDGAFYREAFANSEAYTHNQRGVVLAVYFIHGGKHFEAFANLKTKEGKYIQDTYPFCYQTLEAETVTIKKAMP
jgi:hypothetical protein